MPAHPAGLNYDEEGRLWGVFYYVGASPTRSDGSKFPPQHDFQPLMPPPQGFTGDRDHWHSHAGACLLGLNYENPTLEAEEVVFSEGVSPRECLPEEDSGELALFTEDVRWTPKFHMVYAWIYALNPKARLPAHILIWHSMRPLKSPRGRMEEWTP